MVLGLNLDEELPFRADGSDKELDPIRKTEAAKEPDVLELSYLN